MDVQTSQGVLMSPVVSFPAVTFFAPRALIMLLLPPTRHTGLREYQSLEVEVC